MKRWTDYLKIVSVVMLLLVFAGGSAYAADLEPGTPIAAALSTDITTSINDIPVPSFNVNGYSVIYADDLRAFGFDVIWNNDKRTLTLNRNPANKPETTSPDRPVNQPSSVIGDPLYDAQYNDIIVYIGNRIVPSYTINGATAIYINDLDLFGEVQWKQDSRSIQVKLDNRKLELEPVTVRNSRDLKKVSFTNNIVNNIVSINLIDFYWSLSSQSVVTVPNKFSTSIKPGSIEEKTRSYKEDRDRIFLGSSIEYYYYKDKSDYYTKNPNYTAEKDYIQSPRSIKYYAAIRLEIVKLEKIELDKKLETARLELENKREALLQQLNQELADNNYVPLLIEDTWITHDLIGTPKANIRIKNLGAKTIDAYEIRITCYDSYDRVVRQSISGVSVFNGISQNDNITQGSSESAAWALYFFDNTTKINVQLRTIHFTDGTVWKG
jgi:hypothetical protein